jgi:hypothetical protein
LKIYRSAGLALAFVFAVVGLLFLFIPDRVVGLFNTLSSSLNMTPAPLPGFSLYLILAVGYMYVVTVLAFLMFRHPENRTFPLLLVHAKLASSILSLAFFLLQAHYLIYLANFVIDGAIGLAVLTLTMKARRTAWASA